jgi:hypothetical protein
VRKKIDSTIIAYKLVCIANIRFTSCHIFHLDSMAKPCSTPTHYSIFILVSCFFFFYYVFYVLWMEKDVCLIGMNYQATNLYLCRYINFLVRWFALFLFIINQDCFSSYFSGLQHKKQ